MNTNEKGNIALGEAIAYFTKHNYCVSIPLNDSQFYDLVVEKDGILKTVQVKYVGECKKDNTYVCTLVTTSGTSRKKLYSLVETWIDLLFCYTKNNFCFLIPIKDISTQKSISLYTSKEAVSSRASLNTYNYII